VSDKRKLRAALASLDRSDDHPGSPYVSVYIARGQYEAVLKLLTEHLRSTNSDGRAKQ
jgi:hypothetical protein